MSMFPYWKKAYVIMGGGINKDNKLHEHVIERCDFFMGLPSEDKESTLVIASSSFSLNVKTKLGENGTPLSEASMIYSYLKENGWHGELLCEQQSHDTVGSVYFVLNNYLKPFGICKVSFVTSDFHQERVNLIANHLNRVLFNENFELEILASKTKALVELRAVREKQSCESYKKNLGKINCPSSLLYAFYKHHVNYNFMFKSNVILSDEYLY